MEPLTSILKRARPLNLDEFHLYYCKITWQCTMHILDVINEKCQVKKLSLVKASLNEISITLL